jgi:hypothetical protein
MLAQTRSRWNNVASWPSPLVHPPEYVGTNTSTLGMSSGSNIYHYQTLSKSGCTRHLGQSCFQARTAGTLHPPEYVGTNTSTLGMSSGCSICSSLRGALTIWFPLEPEAHDEHVAQHKARKLAAPDGHGEEVRPARVERAQRTPHNVACHRQLHGKKN